MERDFFKQYIQEHKDAFENEALPPNMLGNILDNLKERREREERREIQMKKRKLTYTWLAVACSIFIIAGAYLLLSQETEKTLQTSGQIVSNEKETFTQPTVIEAESPSIIKKLANRPKQLAVHQTKANPYQEIYNGLADSSSVASRLDAILRIGTLASLNEKLKTELCRTFNEDGNDNVRLAALEVLSKFSNDKYIQEHLMAGLSAQKDPVVQLELVKIVGNNGSPETTDKLIAMANNPFTVDAVKEQVYYALLTNNN